MLGRHESLQPTHVVARMRCFESLSSVCVSVVETDVSEKAGSTGVCGPGVLEVVPVRSYQLRQTWRCHPRTLGPSREAVGSVLDISANSSCETTMDCGQFSTPDVRWPQATCPPSALAWRGQCCEWVLRSWAPLDLGEWQGRHWPGETA